MYCGAGRWLGAQGARGARRRGAGHAGGMLGAQAGRWARRRKARARGRAWQARRQARGRVAWARGLALGSALGALGPFSIRFDSFFFPESLNEHCSL